MKISSKWWYLAAALLAAATFMVIFLISRDMAMGDHPAAAIQIPMIWFLPDITVYFDCHRSLDPLLAALWILLPTAHLLEKKELSNDRYAPFYGLLAAGGVYLVFRGEPGPIVWLATVPLALVISRAIHLLNDRERYLTNGTPPRRYTFWDALFFGNNFGFGVLLPFAVLYSFEWTIYPLYCVYVILNLVMCIILFVPLALLRLVARWLFGSDPPTQPDTYPEAQETKPNDLN